jgi:hypothetical protein
VTALTPAFLAIGETCHTRRRSSQASSAQGCAVSSGCRASSQRRAKSGIQQQAAYELLGGDLRVMSRRLGTRIYPEARIGRKIPVMYLKQL